MKGDVSSARSTARSSPSYDKADRRAAGKLDSPDGVYGIRSAHNTEVMVTGLGKK